jgi:predicted Rossmann fold nucleotide-binding protein DprA/Smf involved in DNA uptake
MLQGGSLKRQVAKQVIQHWCVQGERPLNAVFQLSGAELEQELGLSAEQSAQMRAVQAQVPAQATLLRELLREGIGVLTRVDLAYPESLVQHLPEERLPYLLYYRGGLDLLTQPAIALLGSTTPQGGSQQVATDLAHRLVRGGHTLVGGYAKGIDRLVLDTARKAQGLTVVVLPTGIRLFGKSSTGIEQGLQEGHALLLSPFAPDAQASESAAQARLPLVTGLSDLVVLIEPEFGPSGWPTADSLTAAGLPVCIWRGVDTPEITAWVEAGATPLEDAGSGMNLVNRFMGLESEESAPKEAKAAPARPADEPRETEPLPFTDAESAIESLGRSGRVPEILAHRLRKTHWD